MSGWGMCGASRSCVAEQGGGSMIVAAPLEIEREAWRPGMAALAGLPIDTWGAAA